MVRLLVTYMEQLAPPQGGALSSPLAAAGIAEERPDADDYLSLYQSIGMPLQWDERLRMTREGLLAFLRTRSTALYILRHDGQSVGLCEFVGVGEKDVELKHFGLVPDVQGRRLGPYLLDWSLRAIWNHRPDRVWLHTDTWDHPKAKATYERIGFKAYAEVWEEFPD